MKMDRVNQWLRLAANVGVLIGLLLLVAELRQNTKVSEMGFYMDRRAMANEWSGTVLDRETSDIVAKSILEPEALTPGEIGVLGAFLTLRLNTWRVTYIQEDLGFRDPGSADFYVNLTAGETFGNPAALAWWRQNRDGFPAELVESVDAALQNIDPNFNYRQITTLQKELKNLER